MEDLYKHDPNSWLRRTRFSKTVYNPPIPSQIPVIPYLTKLKLGPSNPSSNRATHPRTTQTTDEVPVESGSKIKKNNLACMKGSISDMFKEVKKTVRSRFMGPARRERTVKSPSSEKKKSSWMKKYFNHEIRQVVVLDKSSAVQMTGCGQSLTLKSKPSSFSQKISWFS